jgi:Ni/Co efflux regulator RcnB
MSKLLSTLIAAAFAVTTFGAAAQTPPAKGDAPKADTQKAEKKAKGDGAKAKGDGKKAKGDGKKSEKAAAPKTEDTKK